MKLYCLNNFENPDFAARKNCLRCKTSVVPHGGYMTSCILSVARLHFTYHPSFVLSTTHFGPSTRFPSPNLHAQSRLQDYRTEASTQNIHNPHLADPRRPSTMCRRLFHAIKSPYRNRRLSSDSLFTLSTSFIAPFYPSTK